MLKDKTIFITGATSGFGLACVKLFLRNGAKIIACGRRKDRLDEIQGELSGDIHVLPLDVRDRKAVKEAVAGLPENFSAVDILGTVS